MKKFCYKFLIITLGVSMLAPAWLLGGAQKANAAAIGAGGGVTGSAVVNGTGTSFPLNPFTITSDSVGDIDTVTNIAVDIVDLTSALLQFDTTSNVTVTTIGTVVVNSPVTPGATSINCIVTTNSVAGDMVVLSGIKLKATANGDTADFSGIAALQAVVAGGTVYGDIISVDAQKPTITGAEIQDLDSDDQIDAAKVAFSENIDDSTVLITDFIITGYINPAFVSTTNGDVADNNYIYLTFDESGILDTFTTPDLTYGSTLTDLAGNLLDSVTITSVNKIPPKAPANLVATAGNGEVSLTWDPAAGAEYYNVYYQKFSALSYLGPIATTQTSTKITQLENGVMYRFIVRAVRTVGTDVIESANAWLEASPTAPKIILASAPVVAVVETIQPETPQVIAPKAETKVETPVEQGKIKGEEDTTSAETEKINWTPWIILFILIILAGAATGGYFYWFGREEEEEIISKKVVEKKPAVKKNGSKAPSKKNKRW